MYTHVPAHTHTHTHTHTVDDLGAILVIATVFASNIVPGFLGLALVCAAGLALLERLGTQSGIPYLAVGAALWFCLLQGGINADIAGVVAATALPAHTAVATTRAPKRTSDPADKRRASVVRICA